MTLDTLAVHAGDRKRAGSFVPVTTPIYSSSSFFYPQIETLDRVFGNEIPGQNYTRYNNPTNALEEQIAALERGDWALAAGSGMAALHLALLAACANACRVAAWLASHPRIERVIFPGDPQHPDAAVVRRLLSPGLYGGMISFEVKGAGRGDIFRLIDALKMIVPATSLGDVHTMILYPPMSSHREISPKHRQRMGIGENFLRLSVGIEAPEDIIEDLSQALDRS
jgi:cystathionine beta-lyase/cystathionine gamma-synthase